MKIKGKEVLSITIVVWIEINFKDNQSKICLNPKSITQVFIERDKSKVSITHSGGQLIEIEEMSNVEISNFENATYRDIIYLLKHC